MTVTNGVIFDEPVYNYTRDIPFIWEEIHVGIGYRDDYERAEQLLLSVARKHTQPIQELSEHARERLKRLYSLEPPAVEPRVYYRMTSNWVELALRFIVRDRGIRQVKDAMYRDILAQFKDAGIEIASSTYDIVGFPPVQVSGVAVAPPSSSKQP